MNTKSLLLHVQTAYITRRGDCMAKWILLGFMDQRWPRVCQRSTSVLFKVFSHFLIKFLLWDHET